MENFFYNDKFYTDLYDLAEDLEFDAVDDLIEDYPDDYTICIELSQLQPVVVFTPDLIAENCILEDRYSEENSDREYDTIVNALKQCIDFEKLNSLMPSLYYGTGKKQTITKQDLLEAKNN
jgi:hypothetical protein